MNIHSILGILSRALCSCNVNRSRYFLYISFIPLEWVERCRGKPYGILNEVHKQDTLTSLTWHVARLLKIADRSSMRHKSPLSSVLSASNHFVYTCTRRVHILIPMWPHVVGYSVVILYGRLIQIDSSLVVCLFFDLFLLSSKHLRDKKLLVRAVW